MKNLIIACLLIISVLTAGCGGGGGGSTPSGELNGPRIGSLSVTTADPTTLITIYGSRFGYPQGSSQLFYGGLPATPTSWLDTQITVKLPANAATYQRFMVQVGGYFSNESPSVIFNGFQNSKITNISSALGNQTSIIPGSQVYIDGQGFGTQGSNSAVSIAGPGTNSIAAAILSWSDTRITCVIPDIGLTQSNYVSAKVFYDELNSTQQFSFYMTIPRIDGINPPTTNIGDTITISGQGFGISQSQVNGVLSIGGITIANSNIVSWTNTLIQAKIPAGLVAASQNISLTIFNKTISNTASPFSIAAPVINQYFSAASSGNASKDNQLSLRGSYFGNEEDFAATSGSPVTRSIQVDGFYGTINPVYWSENEVRFVWPLSNDLIGTKDVKVRIIVGGLQSNEFTVKAD